MPSISALRVLRREQLRFALAEAVFGGDGSAQLDAWGGELRAAGRWRSASDGGRQHVDVQVSVADVTVD